ncbi:MAG: prepilin-type N-terminal cleavage/methylation domain-containing protein [Rickettsiales bacterium]
MWQKLRTQNSELSTTCDCHPVLVSGSKGFTLVELSIVLVIIGLIVGGVLIGRDLIKASEIRSQISQIEQFKTAANAFKLKYGYLPGDIPPTETAQLGFFTFTGPYAGKSALGMFSYRYGFGNASGDIELGEQLVFWQHLSEAKMIAGQYGGIVNNFTVDWIQGNTTGGYTLAGVPLVNGNWERRDAFLPKSKLAHADAYIAIYPNRVYTNNPMFSNSSLPNVFYFYATPNQEFAIDSKIDDGLPDKGTVRDIEINIINGDPSPCVTTTSPKAYILTSATADIPSNCNLNILW